MGKNNIILTPVKNLIVAAVEAGESHKTVSARFNVHRNAVRRLYQRKKKTGSVVRSPKSGRPKKLSSRAAKHLVRAVRINPPKTA